MKQLLKKLIEAVANALRNDPDNVEVVANLKRELAEALAAAKGAKQTADELAAEKADLESLTPDIEALIDLANQSTPPAPVE